jgi:hypothetical protein
MRPIERKQPERHQENSYLIEGPSHALFVGLESEI